MTTGGRLVSKTVREGRGGHDLHESFLALRSPGLNHSGGKATSHRWLPITTFNR
jgi:hypothetical protein